MLFLGFWSTNVVMGLYQLVSKIRNIAGTAVNSVGSVILPRLSYYEAQEGGHTKTARLVAKSLNFLFIAGLLFIGCIVICADPIILILGGDQYLGARVALMIGSATILISPINTVLSQYMIARKQEKFYAIINLIGLITGIALCFALIPHFGIVGAALVSVGLEIVTLLLRLFYMRDFLREIARYLDFGRIAISLAISLAIGYTVTLAIPNINVFLQLIIKGSAIVLPYLILLILFHESFIYSTLSPLINKVRKNHND